MATDAHKVQTLSFAAGTRRDELREQQPSAPVLLTSFFRPPATPVSTTWAVSSAPAML